MQKKETEKFIQIIERREKSGLVQEVMELREKLQEGKHSIEQVKEKLELLLDDLRKCQLAQQKDHKVYITPELMAIRVKEILNLLERE